VIDAASVPVAKVNWKKARRIIRSVYPPIDLFEDIASPEDWPLLIAAEQKTNPRLMAALGALDLIPPQRRVSGAGATYLMSPFTHVSPDRPSRFSGGGFGVLYASNRFETALLETVYHHGRFMALTHQAPGWTSQFRELVFDVNALLNDLRGGDARWAPALDRDNYAQAQILGNALRAAASEGVVYPSQRDIEGECVGLFYPDRATNVIQGRHLDYHWNGERVDFYRDPGNGRVFRIST
jgi:RES domain-containing protein